MPGTTTFLLVLGTAIVIRNKQHRKLMLKSQIKVLLVKRCCCLCSQEAVLKLGLLQHVLVIVTAAQLLPGGCRSPSASCSVKAWSCDTVTSEDLILYSSIYYSDLSADCLFYCTVDFCSSSQYFYVWKGQVGNNTHLQAVICQQNHKYLVGRTYNCQSHPVQFHSLWISYHLAKDSAYPYKTLAVSTSLFPKLFRANPSCNEGFVMKYYKCVFSASGTCFLQVIFFI